ncbi:MAG: hypothetical protein KF795_17080 [Labilithrix sp.]|nr:hypothetical protein [Labilithrix sp.]
MSGGDERPSAGQGASPARDAGASVAREPAALREWRKILPYLQLFDFARRPSSKAAWLVRVAAVGIALFALWRRVDAATQPLLAAKPPPAIPTEEIEDYRFRLPERVRRAIFMELATAELAERARAIQANTWKGHLWSREDDRGHYERVAVRSVAARHKISLSQTYLVLDEGIRERWPGPNGEPLPATTPPLDIRSNSW